MHSKNTGSGEAALKYLANYVFRVAISNNRILSVNDENVTFKYRESKTGQWKIMSLNPFEFIRRFLQHVLPRGFQKIRYYGFMAAVNKKMVVRIKKLLNKKQQPVSQKRNSDDKKRAIRCPLCKKEMVFIAKLLPGMPWPHAPPVRQYELIFPTKPAFS